MKAFWIYTFAAIAIMLALFTNQVSATNTEFTAGTLDPIDLTGQSGTTNWQLGDDAISGTINLGFSFDFYGETFTSGKGATNGCWTFTGYNNTCQDYTPDPLPQSGMDMTIFPLWGDWIRDSGSKMLYKTFGDSSATDQYFVMGWYNMREYNRSSDNTFEMLLYETTNNIEFRYGALNIVQHDIVIGVQGHAKTSSNAMYNASEYKVYLHHNECASGTQHDSNDTNCVNTNWNSTSHNTAIENKSLSIVVDDQYGCAANPLLATTCTGYAVAYLAQQCNLDPLYNTACANYSSALFDAECDDDSQFSPSCPGYEVTQSVAYFDTMTNYGYEDDYVDDYYIDEWYEDDYYEEDAYADNCVDNPDWCYQDDPYWNMEFTDAEWYEIDLLEFGQELVNEWYGSDVEFTDDGYVNYDEYGLTEDTYWTNIDEGMDQWDLEQEQYWEEDFSVVTLLSYEDELLEEFVFQTVVDSGEFTRIEEEWEEFETMEELDEWFEEEMEEEWVEEMFEEFEEFETIEEMLEEELYAEEEIFEEEAVEEIFENIEELQEEEFEEELLAEVEEEFEEILEEAEVELVVTEEPSRRGIRAEQLNVVANSVRAATASVSGTTAGVSSSSVSSGTSSQSTGNTVASGGIASAASGGVSTTSSPSISDQFASASVQTTQILAMSPSTAVSSDITSAGTDTVGSSTSSIGESSTSMTITPLPGMDGVASATMVDVQVSNLSGEIDTAVSGVMTASEADQIADEIIAQNIEEQQQQMEDSAESGEYGDQTALVAYIGFNPGFSNYYSQALPQATGWYESREIYKDVFLSDNITAFYDLAGTSLTTIGTMINSQPDLFGGNE